jgi:hypothetical protein
VPNPTALILLALALLLIVVAYKGTQENWVAAVEGHPPDATPTASASGVSSGSGGLLSGILHGLFPFGPIGRLIP